MPTINPPSKVLVTGASGFIGIHIVRDLIDKGYSVRGCVRSEAKGEYLKNMFGDKYESVIVQDMAAEDAYDRAVQGVDAVIHTASVVSLTVTGHPDLVIKPAVAGTVGILESALKFGPSVKRVLITSSTAAVGEALDESSWNDAAVDYVNKLGAEVHPGMKYEASKVLAERAAWEFGEKKKASMGFDIVTICPPWPMIHEGNTPESVSGSIQWVLGNVYQKPPRSDAELAKKGGDYIDVRDVADVAARILAAEKAGNERFVVAGGSFTWQDLLDYLNESPAFPNTPKGNPGATKDTKLRTPSSVKICEALGRRHEELFRPLRESIRETVTSCTERGWTA